ncbi:MAG TPA: hypothetical protein VFE30_17990 [Anaeromyxobacteraceae bacterium]|jgi:hypothetical protein|nr:hypothetical protein [Anaeromyxobacteraceae bacterium]
MSLRRYTPTLAALGLLAACTPDIAQRTNPQTVTYAAFDPAANPPAIPLPNDLARANAASTTGAQRELLDAFNQAGGFPNDQELPVTIDLFAEAVTTAPRARSAPDLDLTTLKAAPAAGATLAVFQVGKSCTPTGGCQAMTPIPIAIGTTSYAKFADHGTLSIYPAANLPGAVGSGARRWPAGGKFVVALRGGASGVKTTDQQAVQPQAAMYLLLQDKNLADPNNQRLLLQQYPDPAVAAAFGAQLEAIREPLVPAFGLLDQVGVPHRELAVITGFTVAPVAGTVVLADPTAGQMPLPSDFLIDPATNRVVNNPAFGPAAAGLATLDGFSTTAMILAQVSEKGVRASSVAGGALLYKVTATGLQLLSGIETAGAGGKYVANPPQIVVDAVTHQPCASPPYAATCVSPTIGLQPAIPVSLGSSAIALPPLDEATEYAVVVTDGVVDGTGAKLVPNTLAKILAFQNPVFVSGKSQLPGVSDGQAAGLEAMRNALKPIVAQAAVDRPGANVAMAYTFRTQSISGKVNGAGSPGALQLAVLPYSPTLAPVLSAACAAVGVADCANPKAGSTVIYDGVGGNKPVSAAFDKYGIDPAFVSAHSASIAAVIETQIATFNLLDPATGAFNPDPTQLQGEVINVLMALPSATAAAVPACAGSFAALGTAGLKCPPLVIYHHGLADSRAEMLTNANTFASQGMVMVAIDAPKHGDRSFCNTLAWKSLGLTTPAPDIECVPGNFCVPEPSFANQGDPAGAAPGRCRTGTSVTAPLGTLVNKPMLCLSGSCTFSTPNAGFPAASGEYFVSGNFFRTRDSLRQDLIDHAQLIRVLEPVPTGAAIAGADVYNALLLRGLVLAPNPTGTFWMSKSLGSILGAVNVAANPRISNAVFNAGGGTAVDVLTNSPAYKAQVDALFLSLGVDRSKLATDPVAAATYLKTLNVAKWILDPADPINFAKYVQSAPLPNLLPPFGGNANGSVAQPAKPVLAQHALCDQTIANPFSVNLAGNVGLSPLTPTPGTGTGTVQWFVNPISGLTFPPGGPYPQGCSNGVPHRLVTDWGATPGGSQDLNVASLTGKAQTSAASFLLSPVPQLSFVTP